MTFAPHFLKLLSKEQITARVRVSQPLEASGDQKKLCRETRARVMALAGIRSELRAEVGLGKISVETL